MAYKILRGCMYLILYLLFIIGLSWLLFRFDDAVNLITGNYPAIGYYYISFEKGDENIISNIYYKQHIYNEPIDLSNLMLYEEENTSYCLDRKSNIYNDETIRIFLLENGLAELKNIDKALESEIKAQEKAVKKKTGIWEINSNTKVVTLHSIFNVIFNFLNSKLGIILKWIITLVGVGTICTFLLKVIIRILSFRNIDTIFMGGISSGKTTMIRKFEDPDATEGKLLAEITSTKSRKKIKGNRIPVGKKDIYPRLYDNPGNNFGNMIDELKKFAFNKSEKRVVVYVISFTMLNKSNEVNREYIIKELVKAATIVQILKNSKSIKKPNKVIVFFNKCDLVYASEQEYIEDKSHAKIMSIYGKSDELQLLKKYSDCILFGSAVKGWGISELKKIIISLN